MTSLALQSLMRRSAMVTFPAGLGSEAIKALALIATPKSEGAVAAAIAAITRKDTSAASDAVAKMKFDVSKADHGLRLAALSSGLCRVRMVDEVVWQALHDAFARGMAGGAWQPRDVRSIARATARWGTYNRETIPAAMDRYAATRAPYADGAELASIATALSSFPECSSSAAFHSIAQRLILIKDTVSAAHLGATCRAFVRARFKEPTVLRKVVIDQLDRVTPLLEGADATAVLAFWALHDYDGVVNLVEVPPENASGAARRQAAAAQTANEGISKVHSQLTALFRRSVAELNDTVDSIVALLRCITAMSHDQWLCVSEAADEALDAAGVLSQELLAGDAAPTVEQLTALMPRYFQAVRDRPNRLMPADSVTSSLECFAKHAAGRAEEIVAHESSPYFIVTCLLGTSEKECREAATAILLECKAQDAALPTLQTFRYIVSYGDHGDWNPGLVGFLKKSFSLSLEGIPLVQLCTALRCFAAAERACEAAEIDGDDQGVANDFINDVAVILGRRGFGYDVRLLLSLAHSCSIVANQSTPAADAIRTHLANALGPLSEAKPDATQHFKDLGVKALEFLGTVPEIKPSVIAFLELVATNGRDGDVYTQKPSQWMKDNDPSNTILPRTPAELKLDAVLRDMAATRGDNPEQMARLGVSFVKMLKDVHPDNVRFIFEVFADKVIKEDKVLRDAVVHLTQSGVVPQLSGYSLASILNSAAKIRFTYYKPLKEMLECVTDEQWAMLDPVELELAVSALAKLSVKTPRVLLALSERAVTLAPALTERHVCGVISSFQSLGIHDDGLFAALLKRAAEVSGLLTPSAVALLLSGPMAHRLPLTEETAGPLVDRLCRVADDLSPHQKSRIGVTLKKSALPATMLAGASARLLIE